MSLQSESTTITNSNNYSINKSEQNNVGIIVLDSSNDATYSQHCANNPFPFFKDSQCKLI